jgi:hypothetical protein
VIRTSGEHRLSNFLLWQVAYAEIHVMSVLARFHSAAAFEAILDFQRRDRRFRAGLGALVSNQGQRVATAAIAIPLALAVVCMAGSCWWGSCWSSPSGDRELFDLAEQAGVRPLRNLGLVLAGLIPLLTWVVVTPLGEGLSPLESLVAGLLAPFWLWCNGPSSPCWFRSSS